MLSITHGTVIHLLNHNLGLKVLSYSFIIDNLLKWRNKSLLGHWTSFGSLCWHGNTSTCIASNHLDNNSLYIKKSPESYLFVFQTYYVWKVKNNRYNIIYFRWLQLYLWTNSEDDKILPFWMLKISTRDSVIIFADISPMLVLMTHFAIKHSNPYNWLCRSFGYRFSLYNHVFAIFMLTCTSLVF